jgi:hypothetical protein
MAPRPRRPNGRRRLPRNDVYDAIQAAGGPSAVCGLLGISLATLARWRRVGRVSDPAALLRWAAAIHPEVLERQLALAWRLAGIRRGTRKMRHDAAE